MSFATFVKKTSPLPHSHREKWSPYRLKEGDVCYVNVGFWYKLIFRKYTVTNKEFGEFEVTNLHDNRDLGSLSLGTSNIVQRMGTP